MTSNRQIIVIYTDGACSNNGKAKSAGGIGIYFPCGELKDVSKVFREGLCTNQRTELYAILFAIKLINKEFGLDNVHLIIKTDSAYSINCVTKWIKKWLNNGWKNTAGEIVSNKEMIEQIYKYVHKHSIVFEHVSAHTGMDDDDSVGNDCADRLAVKARDRAIKELKDSPNKVPNKVPNRVPIKKSINRKTVSKSQTKSKSQSTSSQRPRSLLEDTQLFNSLIRNKKPSNSNSAENIIVELIKSKN